MRTYGTIARGIRLPIITAGDDLVDIVIDSVLNSALQEGYSVNDNDIIGITEAIVAKSQGNYASIEDIANDVKQKFPQGEVGVVFPILSRNRFFNVLKGIANGVKKVYVLLSYPQDEVGNPISALDALDEVEDTLAAKGLLSETQFREITGEFVHPFTGIDYAKMYRDAGDNVEIYFAKDARDILKLTPYVIDAEIHFRERTRKRLLKAGAQTVYCLSDILSQPINNSGYNAQYGVLGSNIATDTTLKLFPQNCDELVSKVQLGIKAKIGKDVHVLVYGDGAFKDPVCGIWELADPVVSPAFTPGLKGTPNEVKLKYIADNNFAHLNGEQKRKAVTEFIHANSKRENSFAEGTTPRRYHDLLGSLCDLMSGSGDKGTPVVLISGYFDNYANE